MPKINLGVRYQVLLTKLGLDEKTMHPQQKVQLKQMFYATVGEILIIQRDELAVLDEDTACDELDGMVKQVSDFYLKETGQAN